MTEDQGHPSTTGTGTAAREVDLALLEQVRSDLDDVDRALRRLEEGSYGRCQACGQAIGDDQLAVVPTARHCGAHEQVKEPHSH